MFNLTFLDNNNNIIHQKNSDDQWSNWQNKQMIFIKFYQNIGNVIFTKCTIASIQQVLNFAYKVPALHDTQLLL